MELPDVSNLSIAKIRCGIVRQRTQPLFREVHFPGRRLIQRAKNMKQSAFSCAGLAHDREHLPSADLKRKVFKEH